MANIPNITLAIIRQYQQFIPVDVRAIAEHLGIKVHEGVLSEDVSGKLVKDTAIAGPSGYAIVVNGAHAETRKRFTIAHELAHFVLHREKIENGEILDNALYRSNLTEMAEVEANRLAANILMPYPQIEALKSQGVVNPTDLANRFAVSEAAMRIRLGVPIEQ